MPLATGARLQHYEILGPLGAGGMGEVYRAVDSKLRREVAIKVLPPAFSRDASRLARFEREAHVLASLNHPHIAAIYGLEHADGVRFLVLELVEGPTLADRLKSGPIEISEALRIASEIAEALEAAHEKGVVHRDLKPANIKLTTGGKVKVLDFGLAKAVGDPEPSSDASNSPTLTMQETSAGIILGTAAYMSPEQAEGKPVDKRADIWSFGIVLYEMLSGRRCFDGKTVSHVLVHVIEQEPDWSKLPDSLPSGLRDLLKRCLEKDPSRRLRDIGDVRLLLEGTAEQTPATVKSARPSAVAAPSGIHPRWLWLGLILFFLSTAVLGALYFRPKPAPAAQVTRFEIQQPANVTFSNNFALSPDGRKLAFIASEQPRIWIRSMDGLEPRPLAGTEGATGAPFWSPDSRYVVFWAGRKLQKIEAAGGPAQTICDSPNSIIGGFWTPDDRIVFAVQRTSGLQEVPSSGGTPTSATKFLANELRHAYPSLLPDDRHFVYARFLSVTEGGIYLGSLDGKPDAAPKKLLPDASPVVFSATSPNFGYILFERSSTLMALPLNVKRLETAGEAFPVAEQVNGVVTSNNFSASVGALVYRGGGGLEQQLTWFDRQGKSLGPAGDPWIFSTNAAPALSPDGKHVAVSRVDGQSSNIDIWLLEFARGVSTRFTFDSGADQNPVWSPDGSKIVFAGLRGGEYGVYWKASNLVGPEELVYKSGSVSAIPTSWSKDGRFVLYQSGGAGVFALPMEGEHKPIPVLPAEFDNRGARFSPDGRFYSYLSSESGKDEVYVRSFDPSSPSGGGKWQISKNGGAAAHWISNGKEILYMAPDQTLMSVDISTNPVFQSGAPKPLFRSNARALYWDTLDGQRILAPVQAGANAAAPYTVVLNWTSLLPKPR